MPEPEEATTNDEETTEVVITEGEPESAVVASDQTVVVPPPAVSDKAAVQIAKEATKQEQIRGETQVDLSKIDAKTRLQLEQMIDEGLTRRAQMEKEALETAVAGEVTEKVIEEDEDPETVHPFYRTWGKGRKKA